MTGNRKESGQELPVHAELRREIDSLSEEQIQLLICHLNASQTLRDQVMSRLFDHLFGQ